MFLKLTKVLVISCFLSFISFSTYAQSNIKRMVVFGDSLSDNGNLFKYSGMPEKPYFDGRFSNGTVWVELLANALLLDTHSSKQFADYAFGGAWAADSEGNEGGLVPLSYERTLYVSDYPTHSIDESNTLFVMWIGNNDYLQDGRLQEDPSTVVNKTLSAIEAHIEKLIDTNEGAGAKHFLILNLPGLGQTPKALEAIAHGETDYATNISLLAKMHNERLAELIKRLANKHPEVEFIPFDLAGYFNDLVQHPEKYQIQDVTHPCYISGFGKHEMNNPSVKAVVSALKINNRFAPMTLQPNLLNAYYLSQRQQQSDICVNPDDYLFWDYVHPTTRAHELISHFVIDVLTSAKHG